jgi:hypothetical protein
MVESIVTARAFELVDADGNRRACLATDPDGNPAFQLYGRDGITRLQLAVAGSDQARITIMNKAGNEILIANVDDAGNGSVEITDGQGTPRALMDVRNDGTASFVLLETLRSAPIMIRLNADGTYDGSFVRDPVIFEMRPKLMLVKDKERKSKRNADRNAEP